MMLVSQGSGLETGTTSLRLWSTEQTITEPRFKKKGHKPHLLMEEWWRMWEWCFKTHMARHQVRRFWRKMLHGAIKGLIPEQDIPTASCWPESFWAIFHLASWAKCEASPHPVCSVPLVSLPPTLEELCTWKSRPCCPALGYNIISEPGEGG